MTIHCYRRVSARVQVDNNSLNVQADKNAKYCAFKFSGQQMEDYVDPAVSASIPWFERPDGARMWANLMPGDHIVVPTVDRAFRSVRDMCDSIPKLMERGVFLHFLDFGVDTSTPVGNMLLTIVVAVKEFEKATIRERQMAVHEWKRANKIPTTSRRPFGWKREGKGRVAKFKPFPEERRLGYYIVHLRQEVGLSLTETYFRLFRERRIGNQLITGDSRFYIDNLSKATRNGFPTPYDERVSVLPWEKENRQPTPEEACQAAYHA